MSEQSELLLEFVRSMAHHSGLRGDRVGALLATAATCIEAGTGTTRVEVALATPTGEDVLLAHEVGLQDALDASGVRQIGAEPSHAALLAGTAGDGAVVDEDGAAWLSLRGEAGPVAAFRLAAPPHEWGHDGTALGFAASVVDELAITLLRHWREQQHIDRMDALLQAQRHTHVGCFEWDIITDKVRWSDELFRIYGNEPQEFEPTFEEFLERIHEDDRDSVRASVYQAYEDKLDYRIEERIVRPDGAVRQLASWGHVIVDEDKVPIKILGSCQDVTDFRAAMRELAETERRLAEVQERRTHALELNDNVVQGLATALYALELGEVDKATLGLAGTLGSARTLVGHLLTASGENLDAATLTRSEPAPSFLASDPPCVSAPPTTEGMIRVVVADDSSDIRLLASMMLTAEPDFHVVAEAVDGLEAVDQVRAHQPEIVLLDLAMPRLDGLEAIPQIVRASPDTTIVVFSGFNAANAAPDALARGAHAYVEKGQIDVSLPSLLRTFRSRFLSERALTTTGDC